MPLPEYSLLIFLPCPLHGCCRTRGRHAADQNEEARFRWRRRGEGVPYTSLRNGSVDRSPGSDWNTALLLVVLELERILLFLFALTAIAMLTISRKPALQHFLTEPEFTAVKIDVLQNNDPSALAPGYIFIAPYKRREGWGPQIFDNEGNLVWFGGKDVKRRAIDLHPCLYNSTSFDHLCYNDAYPKDQGGHSSGVIRFFNNSYTQVGEDYGGVNGLIDPDIHELNTPAVLRGRAFLQDIFQPREMDLSPYGGPKEGYILDGCFQEIDIETHEAVFEWCALDHVDIDDTYVYMEGSGNYTLPGLAGNGHKDEPWDFFHINAIDRNSDGDYIISTRHTRAIYHVAGPNNKQGYPPGQTIWRLGGKFNNFTMRDSLNFSSQHSIRYLNEKTETGSIVYLFDNAWESHTATADASSGIVIDLNTKNMTASLVSRYVQPSGLLASDQGNLQMLPNGNGFLGWGHCNYYSEHAPTGEVLLYAQFGGKGDCDEGQGGLFVSSYRAWKFAWKGYPRTSPKVFAYAQTCSAPLYGYASWNGATEVAHWKFFASNHSSNGTAGDRDHFTLIATVAKSGFETRANLGSFSLFVYVESLDSDGNSLGMSPIVQSFVPRRGRDCGETGCVKGTEYSKANSKTAECAPESSTAQGLTGLPTRSAAVPVIWLRGLASTAQEWLSRQLATP